MVSRSLRGFSSLLPLGIRRRMRFDFAHGLGVIKHLATGRAFVKLQIWNGINFAFEIVGPIAFHFFDLVAATGWANGDFNHRYKMTSQSLRRLFSHAGFGIRRRMRFDFAHSLRIIHSLAAIGTFVKFQIRHDVGLALKISYQVPPNLFNFFAAASRAQS